MSIAGKHDASIEEIKTFVQRRFQYAQLLPNQQLLQPFNQDVQTQEAPSKPGTKKQIEADTPQAKKKFDGTCQYCAIYGNKWAECRKRQRDAAAGHNNSQAHKTSEPQTNAQSESQPKFNAKLVCQLCGYTGHSAKRLPLPEFHRRQHTEVCPTTDSPHQTIETFDATSGEPKMVTTQPMN